MALSKGLKQIPEVVQQAVPVLHISEVITPHEQWKPANYIPVKREDPSTNEFFVVEAGRAVGITARTEARFTGTLTLANGGSAQTITYAADDISKTEDVDNPDNVVTVAGAASATDTANFPLGIVLHPIWQGTIPELNKNFRLQDVITVYAQAYVEYPVLFDTQDTGAQTLVEGRGLMPGAVGELVLWRDGTDSVDQLVGRCWQISAIAAVGDLDKVRTMTGLGLAGTGTSGIPQHLNFTHTDDATAAVTKFRALINAG
jgi:hypothetical protein